MMTPDEFTAVLKDAGYLTRQEMADALGVSLSLIYKMIEGKVPITKRTQMQVRMLSQGAKIFAH